MQVDFGALQDMRTRREGSLCRLGTGEEDEAVAGVRGQSNVLRVLEVGLHLIRGEAGRQGP